MPFAMCASVLAQEQKDDGTWWDNNLEFIVVYENIKLLGEIEFCVFDAKRELCTEGLMTAYEVRIYDESDIEIWNSLWTGKTYDLKFKKKFPEAEGLEIIAKNNFVVNHRTGTRIYQDNPMYLKVELR